MTPSDYIFELDWDIDIDNLLRLINSPVEPGMKVHQRSVELDPYLISLREKFPILSPTWNIYKFGPYDGLPPHIDGKRKSAINIPLIGSENSITKFFSSKDKIVSYYDETRVLHAITSELKEEFSFTLSKPTLINNSVPHSVRAGPTTRIIISWSISDLDFYQARDYFIAALQQ